MNIINAIINLANNPVVRVTATYKSKNRANSAGDALEEYVKDLFAGTFDTSKKERIKKWNQVFSYLGGSNSPPDAMLKEGDALEVKKIESDSQIALNSSYPKHKLYSDDSKITQRCKDAEKWDEKDIIYIVGIVNGGLLKSLCMVYGLDYCASRECYEGLLNCIKEGVVSVPDVDFSTTKEIAHINKVDPLKITYMRVRGMWGIENPWSVFDYVYERDDDAEFNFMCIINEDKWNTFENTKDLEELALFNELLKISEVEIQDPDNPATLIKAKLITITKKGE